VEISLRASNKGTLLFRVLLLYLLMLILTFDQILSLWWLYFNKLCRFTANEMCPLTRGYSR